MREIDYGVHIEHKSTDYSNHKVLLCDLDGTLIVTKSGKTFPVDENDWQFKDGVKEAIQNYNPRYIFIVTNQGGIEKGYVGESSFFQKFKTIIENIRTWGDYVVDGVYCTSTDKNSWFRKPNVGMIDYFRNDWTQRYNFNNEDALMIGDMETDQECAKNAGISYLDVEEFIRLNKEVSDNVDKLRAISTPADEDWFKVAEEWEKEDKKSATLRDELIESSRALYYDIDRCITDLLMARFDKDEQHERKALSRMESLMVDTQQQLCCITDYLEKEDKQ